MSRARRRVCPTPTGVPRAAKHEGTRVQSVERPEFKASARPRKNYSFRTFTRPALRYTSSFSASLYSTRLGACSWTRMSASSGSRLGWTRARSVSGASASSRGSDLVSAVATPRRRPLSRTGRVFVRVVAFARGGRADEEPWDMNALTPAERAAMRNEWSLECRQVGLDHLADCFKKPAVENPADRASDSASSSSRPDPDANPVEAATADVVPTPCEADKLAFLNGAGAGGVAHTGNGKFDAHLLGVRRVMMSWVPDDPALAGRGSLPLRLRHRRFPGIHPPLRTARRRPRAHRRTRRASRLDILRGRPPLRGQRPRQPPGRARVPRQTRVGRFRHSARRWRLVRFHHPHPRRLARAGGGRRARRKSQVRVGRG